MTVTTTPETAEPPGGIASLASRYDPDVIDVPGGRAVVRLCVRGGESWDARISSRRVRVIRGGPRRRSPARPWTTGGS